MVAGSTSHPSAGSTGSEYRKIQELASGGMGSVELSRAISGPRAGEIVAIKRLHAHLEREKHFADMFFDEAWITAGLNHPNVGAVFEWGTDSVGRYLAMEYVPGDSLLLFIREAKKQEFPIPIDIALYIIAKTAEGLHAAHELRNEHGALRHLVHRDVTPSNIMVGIHGEVKLIDFGVAKARDKLSHTSTGTIKGKFGYMSPEQARGFPIDRRSDVFSLGVVLWETFALRRLYRSESELEILRMIVEDPPQPIREVRPDVPEPIERLLSGALAKNRDDRLGSCGEFADFIWAIYHEHGFTAAEQETAAYFRTLLPERFHAIEQLLTGAHEFIEPTTSRPASGSFSGSNPQNVSGAVARPAAVPLLVQKPPQQLSFGPTDSVPSLVAASYAAPQQPAERRRWIPLAAAAVVTMAGAAGGVAWWNTHNAPPPTPIASTPSVAQPSPLTTANTAAVVAPNPPPAQPAPVPTVVAPNPQQPASTAVVAHGGGGHGSSHHASHNSEQHVPTQEETARAMLQPAQTNGGSTSNGTSHGSTASSSTSQSDSSGSSSAHSNSSTSSSGSSTQSSHTASGGSGGSSSNGTSNGSATNAGSGNGSHGVRDLFGHDYGR